MSSVPQKYWLLKAEPDTRIVKGKDVRFSVDDFERVKTSPWEGVRNYEARNLMKEMKEGDKALFYHSNCKTPGIAAFAQVSKEAYPDYTAWDESHPYFDPKSDSENPKWFMVDLTFTARARHFVPLALLRSIASQSGSQPPEEIKYLGEEGVKAIKGMNLVTRGRLSVQRVEEDAWHAITRLAETGGFENLDTKPKKSPKVQAENQDTDTGKSKPKAASRKTKVSKSKTKANEEAKNSPEHDEGSVEGDDGVEESKKPSSKKASAKRKHEAVEELAGERDGLRRSTRTRK